MSFKEERRKVVEDFINNAGNEEFDKKDATIFFRHENGVIVDITVQNTPKGNPKGDETYERHRRSYGNDMGNSFCTWDEWYNLPVILTELAIFKGFASKEIAKKAIVELYKIKEFKRDLAPMFTSAHHLMVDFSDVEL